MRWGKFLTFQLIVLPFLFVSSMQRLIRLEANTGNLFPTLDKLIGVSDVYIAYHASWCPDCQSIPAAVESLREQSELSNRPITIVMCDIGEKGPWRSGEHPLKMPKQLDASVRDSIRGMGLKGIPTLMKWSSTGTEEGRLETGLYDGSAFQQGGEEGVKKLVAKFVN
jgi:thiol-disulfide isomerase/thioredoxin